MGLLFKCSLIIWILIQAKDAVAITPSIASTPRTATDYVTGASADTLTTIGTDDLSVQYDGTHILTTDATDGEISTAHPITYPTTKSIKPTTQDGSFPTTRSSTLASASDIPVTSAETFLWITSTSRHALAENSIVTEASTPLYIHSTTRNVYNETSTATKSTTTGETLPTYYTLDIETGVASETNVPMTTRSTVQQSPTTAKSTSHPAISSTSPSHTAPTVDVTTTLVECTKPSMTGLYAAIGVLAALFSLSMAANIGFVVYWKRLAFPKLTKLKYMKNKSNLRTAQRTISNPQPAYPSANYQSDDQSQQGEYWTHLGSVDAPSRGIYADLDVGGIDPEVHHHHVYENTHI